MKKHTIAGLVLACATIAPLTGCSQGKDAPPPVGTPAASSPSTPKSSTSTSPTPPPEAMKNTKAGAEAFIRWYARERWAGVVTNDPTRVASYMDPSCKECAEERKASEKRKDEKAFIAGNLTVQSAGIIKQPDGIWQANLAYKAANATYTTKSGKVTSAPLMAGEDFFIQYEDAGWVVKASIVK